MTTTKIESDRATETAEAPSPPELMPCPFCGKLPKLFQIPKHYDSRFEKPSGETVDRVHCENSSCAIRNISMTPEAWSHRAAHEAEVERLRQLIIDAHQPHSTCYWGLGFMFSPDTMKEDCVACAAKRQMKSIANGSCQ